MTEELKIIMDALTQLGAHGKEAFVWWLIVKYVLHYATIGFFIATAGFVITRIVKAIRTHQDECRLVAELALKAGVRPCSYYDRQEFGRMYEWIRSK